MFRLNRELVNPLKLLRSYPWPQSTATSAILDASKPLEEEETPYYDPKRFYPARLGEVLNDRYQVAAKLGYGSSSTVWLARDLFQWRWAPERYVAVKITAADRPGPREADNELHITQLITDISSHHLGKLFVRGLLDSFNCSGPNNQHLCLVYEPLREPLWLTRRRFPENVIPADILKVVVEMLLHGLDFLHSDCKVIHTDLKLDNIMGKLEDNTILEKSALDEYLSPLPQKHCGDRTIYLSRNQYGNPSNIAKVLSAVSITDFGFARRSSGPHHGAIQAEPLRAPEVILDAGWSYSADIWNLVVMLWDLLENRPLFEPVEFPATYDEATHLACITALLGPPPATLLARGERTTLFYNAKGELDPPRHIPDMNLETAVTKIDCDDEKRKFINFIKRMLKWNPSERSTARELLDDPWIERIH